MERVQRSAGTSQRPTPSSIGSLVGVELEVQWLTKGLGFAMVIAYVPVSMSLTDYNPNCGPFADNRFVSIYSGLYEYFSVVTSVECLF